MEESDFKKLFDIAEIRNEYEEIKSIDQDYFTVINECFNKIKTLEKYLDHEIKKSFLSLKVGYFLSVLFNTFNNENKDEVKIYLTNINNELISLYNLLNMIKKKQKMIDHESLKELKNYYLAMRFLNYYYKLLVNNYNIKINRLVNLEKGIIVNIPMNEDISEEQNIKMKIKKYYEVSDGKNKKN